MKVIVTLLSFRFSIVLGRGQVLGGFWHILPVFFHIELHRLLAAWLWRLLLCRLGVHGFRRLLE